MNVLFVMAHPDDEVLGAGATIHKLVKEGHKVAVATLVNSAGARANLSDTLSADQEKAFSIMGVHKAYGADFPNIQMNTVPHLKLVQFIESCIGESPVSCSVLPSRHQITPACTRTELPWQTQLR